MVLIDQSVETSKSPSMAARSLAGPTSRRPCRRADLEEALNNNAQYPRIPSKVLKGAPNEEISDDEACVITSILNVWSVETPRYPAWLQDSGRATRGMPT
jgi:hypothetical protein